MTYGIGKYQIHIYLKNKNKLKSQKLRICPNGYIVFLTNSFAATTGTNTRNATFKFVHSDLLNKTWNVHQQYENVTIEVSHSSMFKNLYSISMFINRIRQNKTAGAGILPTGSEITEKGQLPCNTYLNDILL